MSLSESGAETFGQPLMPEGQTEKEKMNRNWHHRGEMVEKAEQQNKWTFSNSECRMLYFVSDDAHSLLFLSAMTL